MNYLYTTPLTNYQQVINTVKFYNSRRADIMQNILDYEIEPVVISIILENAKKGELKCTLDMQTLEFPKYGSGLKLSEKDLKNLRIHVAKFLGNEGFNVLGQSEYMIQVGWSTDSDESEDSFETIGTESESITGSTEGLPYLTKDEIMKRREKMDLELSLKFKKRNLRV